MSRMDTDAAVTYTITNWRNSKASSNADGGLSSLVGWIEKKAGHSLLAYEVQGDALLISVPASAERSFSRLNGFQWAGTTITAAKGQSSAPPRGPRNQNQPTPGGPRGQQNGFPPRNNAGRGNDLASRVSGANNHQNNQFNQPNSRKELFNEPARNSRSPFNQQHNQSHNQQHNQQQSGRSSFGQKRNDDPNPLEDVFISVIRKRYNAQEKFLNFSALPTDPEVQSSGLASESANKFFQALFVVCQNKVFETASKRREMVESLSFANNSLASVKDIIAAASAFPDIKNLDLSNNNFQNIRDLTWWKRRFPKLEHIILTGNPIDSPKTRQEVRSWYPNLKQYNLQDVNAPWPGTNGLQAGIEAPAPSASPAIQELPTEPHPEFPPGSTFGVATPDKPQDQLLKEQLGLRFSYETSLKMKWVEECLVSNNFDYDRAMADYNRAANEGAIPVDAYLQV